MALTQIIDCVLPLKKTILTRAVTCSGVEGRNSQLEHTARLPVV